jgi:hypothetical protein
MQKRVKAPVLVPPGTLSMGVRNTGKAERNTFGYPGPGGSVGASGACLARLWAA